MNKFQKSRLELIKLYENKFIYKMFGTYIILLFLLKFIKNIKGENYDKN